MDNYHKSDDMFKIEDKLPFMRNYNKEDCPIELVEPIDKTYKRYNYYKIALSLAAKSEL